MARILSQQSVLPRVLDTPAEIEAAIKARDRIADAPNFGTAVNVIVRNVKRAAIDLVGSRGFSLTTGARRDMQRLSKRITELRSKRATPEQITEAKQQLQNAYEETCRAYQRTLEQAQLQHHLYNDVPQRDVVVRDLTLTLEALRETYALLVAPVQPPVPKVLTVPPAPGPKPRPQPRPTPSPPVTPPAPPPGPPPAPTLLPKTPEQIEAENELKKLLEELKKKREEQKKDHDASKDPIDSLNDALKKMGNEAGMNDFKPPLRPEQPPQNEDEFSPSMDERKAVPEGQELPPPMFYIEPPIQGYFELYSFDEFEAQSVKWKKSDTRRISYPSLQGTGTHTIQGQFQGSIGLPLPPGYLVDPNTIAPSSIAVWYDPGSGATILTSPTAAHFIVSFGKISKQQLARMQPHHAKHSQDIITGQLSPATEAKIAEARAILDTAQRAKFLAEYVQDTLEYSNESAFNYTYKRHPSQYFQSIETHKKADCDVANTYFVALCRRAGIPAKLTVGYKVDGSINGKTEIRSSSAHAWAKIWDGTEWKSIDATPPGSPSEETGQKQNLYRKNPEEEIDIKTEPKKAKQKADDQAKELEKALEQAMKKNEYTAVSKDEIDRLKKQAGQSQKTATDELVQELESHKKKLADRLEELNQQGKVSEANELIENLKQLDQISDQIKRDGDAHSVRDQLKKTLEKATRGAHEEVMRKFLEQKRRAFAERAKGMLEEAEKGKEDDLI